MNKVIENLNKKLEVSLYGPNSKFIPIGPIGFTEGIIRVPFQDGESLLLLNKQEAELLAQTITQRINDYHRVVKLLTKLEFIWMGGSLVEKCPCCGGSKMGHNKGCELDNIIHNKEND